MNGTSPDRGAAVRPRIKPIAAHGRYPVRRISDGETVMIPHPYGGAISDGFEELTSDQTSDALAAYTRSEADFPCVAG